MGSITKLPTRVENRLLNVIEARVEMGMPLSEEDRRAAHQIFTPEVLQRRETQETKYSAQLTKQAVHELKKLDRHQLEVVQEKMRRIIERPAEIGDEKHGRLRGQKTLKVDSTSHVLMFAFDVRCRTVTFTAFGHHDTIYNLAPRIENFVPFEEWMASC